MKVLCQETCRAATLEGHYRALQSPTHLCVEDLPICSEDYLAGYRYATAFGLQGERYLVAFDFDWQAKLFAESG